MAASITQELLPATASTADVVRYARRLNDRQFTSYCGSCSKLLMSKDRDKAGSNVLRQLLLITTVSPWLSLTSDLCRLLYSIMTEPQQGPAPLRMLACHLLQLNPCISEPKTFSAPMERCNIPLAIHLLQAQSNSNSLLPSHLTTLVKWLKEDKELALSSLPFVVATNIHLQKYIEPVYVQQVSTAMSRFLGQASVQQPQASNKAMFKGSGVAFEEPDGGPSPPPFTPLCMGKAYSRDHIRSVHSFSSLRGWSQRYSHQTTEDGEAPEDRLLLAPVVQDTFVEQCTRVLEQALVNTSDKVSRRELDQQVTVAAAVEAVKILRELCYNDSSIIPHLLPLLKRALANAIKEGPPKAALHAACVDFFAHHGRVAVFDSTNALQTYFGPLLAQLYWQQAFALSTVELLVDHLDFLRAHSVMINFLPNILKILAWHPRLFLQEYLEILPSLITPPTCVEIFHCLLDLPCMTAALQLRRVKPLEQLVSESDHPHISMALFNYITRSEGGLGGTIDRLGELHELLSSQRLGLRVQSAAEVVPLLLRGYFDVMLKDADAESLKELVPVVLERVVVLYDIEQLGTDVQAVLADVILHIFKQQPGLVIDLKKELLDFINNRSNVSEGREDFFLHVVWIIGEYTSPELDERCDTSVMVLYHEALESFSYEVKMTLQTSNAGMVNPAYEAIHTTRLMNVLMMALAKIATRCPEVLPRVILNLSKIMDQHNASNTLQAADKALVLDRARLLVNTLKQPAVAAAVLNSASLSQNGDKTTALSQHVDAAGTLAMLQAIQFAQGRDTKQ
eukprot:m.67784 g.67784  ORF g.67784 m.67784 type:complete len:793 (-) comp14085_c0_seq1:14-2392(-)